MKICFVNCSTNGSTGNIIKNLCELSSNSFEFCGIFGEDVNFLNKKDYLSIGSKKLFYKWHRIETFIFGNDGFLSFFVRKKILKFLRFEKPDLIHIHNPHRSFCNLSVIFDYCLKNNLKVIWTLHDLWAFTGRCCTPLSCELWKTGCHHCPNKKLFPKTLIDSSTKYQKIKFEYYKKLNNKLVFVAPSQWMLNQIPSDITNRRFLINNGIDTNVFKPSEQNNLILSFSNGRTTIGAAALFFNELKGKGFLMELSRVLDNSEFCLVLIGSEKSNIEYYGKNLMIMPKTFSILEMAKFYNSCDIFINPTQTDNYPTTHLESISCGTPVITFDVGGAKEMIDNGKTGFAVPLNDLIELIAKIKFIKGNKNIFNRFSVSNCRDFSLNSFCAKYEALYLTSSSGFDYKD